VPVYRLKLLTKLRDVQEQPMSTGCECEFIEASPGAWYYVLEHDNAPKNAWDWRDHAAAYGPFALQAKAKEHLSAHHANPGGYSVFPYAEFSKRAPQAVLQRLLEDAPRRTAALKSGSLSGFFRRFGDG
jgi:hypothetical protein